MPTRMNAKEASNGEEPMREMAGRVRGAEGCCVGKVLLGMTKGVCACKWGVGGK